LKGLVFLIFLFSTFAGATPCALLLSFPDKVLVSLSGEDLSLRIFRGSAPARPLLSRLATPFRLPVATASLVRLESLRRELQQKPDSIGLHREVAETFGRFFRRAGISSETFESPVYQPGFRVRLGAPRAGAATFVDDYLRLHQFLSDFGTALEFGTVEFARYEARFERDFREDRRTLVLGESPNLMGNHNSQLAHELYHFVQEVLRRQKRPEAWAAHRHRIQGGALHSEASAFPFPTPRGPLWATAIDEFRQNYQGPFGFSAEEIGAHRFELLLLYEILSSLYRAADGQFLNYESAAHRQLLNPQSRRNIVETALYTERVHEFGKLAYANYTEAIGALSRGATLHPTLSEHFIILSLPSGNEIWIERRFYRQSSPSPNDLIQEFLSARRHVVDEMQGFADWNTTEAFAFYHQLWHFCAWAANPEVDVVNQLTGERISYNSIVDFYRTPK